MKFVHLFIVALNIATSVFCDRHNEQQIGNYNYDAELEDISFLIFDGAGDTDYSYDYSDLTVKPEDGSTSTTGAPADSSSSSTEANLPSSIKPEETNKPNQTMEHPLNTENFQIPVVVVTETAKLKKGYVSSSTLRKKQGEVETESLPKRTCLQGFILDEKNRCKRIIRKSQISTRSPKPPLPTGLRYPQKPQQLKESK